MWNIKFDPIICPLHLDIIQLFRSSYFYGDEFIILCKNYETVFFGINCTVFAYLTKGISKVLYLKHAKKVLWYRFKKRYSLVIWISDYISGKLKIVIFDGYIIKSFFHTMFSRGNNLTSLKELQKLQPLPMLRALVLSGMKFILAQTTH